MANSVRLSDGTTIPYKTFTRRVENAKKAKKQKEYDEKGYLSCSECGKNSSGCPGIAASHIISVNECVGFGKAEIAYDLNNILLHGQKCHRKFENKPFIERNLIYLSKIKNAN